jgi:hypothetical protein
MTTFYEQFKSGAAEAVQARLEVVRKLGDEWPKIQKRLDDERNKRGRIEDDITELKKSAGEALLGSQNSYEKYRVSLTKLNGKLEASESLIRSLLEDILPKKQSELNVARQNLRSVLNNYLMQCKNDVRELMIALLWQCVNTPQSFLDAFARIYRDYGLAFDLDERDYPDVSIWTKEKRRALKADLLDLGVLPTFEPVFILAPKPQTTPETPQNEPVSPETPAEGNMTPSEPTLQATEPQDPIDRVSGAEPKPSRTILTGTV